MYAAALALLKELGGFATTAQLLTVMTRQQLRVQVQKGGLVRVWYGVYAAADPDLIGRLAALDLFMGQRVVACMGTAAALHGFDLENTCAVHVLDPGVRMRPTVGLMVHQRTGAPLQRVAGRLATAPAWTAVEVARQLRRPRALAALDAALHSLACTRAELESAVREQKGRRGIVSVRELVQYADGRAESGMESEARLVMIDFGLCRGRSCSTRSTAGTESCGVSTLRGQTNGWPQSTRASIGTWVRPRCSATRSDSRVFRNSLGPSSR
jgi:hypothetical protein